MNSNSPSKASKQGSLDSFWGRKRQCPETKSLKEEPIQEEEKKEAEDDPKATKRQRLKSSPSHSDDLLGPIQNYPETISTPNWAVKVKPVIPEKEEAITVDFLKDNKFNPEKRPAVTIKEHVRFDYLCAALDLIEELKGSGTGSKKTATSILCNLFRSVLCAFPGDLLDIMCFILNKVVGDLSKAQIGIGDSTIMKVVSELYGRSEASLKSQLSELEDLGSVAAASRQTTRMLTVPQPMSIDTVMNDLRFLAETVGGASQAKKKGKIMKLLRSGTQSEVKFLVRFFQQKMRIGIQAQTVYQALAHAVILTDPTGSEKNQPSKRKAECVESAMVEMELAIKESLARLPNLKAVLNLLLQGVGAADLLLKCDVECGTPINPMLAKPITGIEELLEKFSNEEFTCEYKYDGERCQVHKMKDGTIRIFSRNMENSTEKYPDVVNICKEILKEDVEEIIIDAEVVAWDRNEQKILPFQILSTRRKKNVQAAEVTVQIMLFPFDCMKLNEESLLRKTLKERREILYSSMVEVENKCRFATHTELSNVEEIETFLQESIEGQCEGLIVKTMSSTYEPSKRTLNWTKLKKDYIDALGDSIDAVPVGAFFGKGKRSKVFGSFILTVYDAESETYQSICKIGTGFSDSDLNVIFEELNPQVIPAKKNYYNVPDRLTPDVWFEPTSVWEIKAADLSLSPLHTAAMGLRNSNKGIALRFPRFVRFRPDKTPEQSTSPEQITEMFDTQSVFKKSKKSKQGQDREDGAGNMSPNPIEDCIDF